MASIYHRRPRLEEEVCVHVVSRVVQRRYLLDDEGKREMRRLLGAQAQFAGMEVITFCLMGNHLHLFVRVEPERARGALKDEELLRRFRALYGMRRSPSLGVDADTLEVVLAQNGERAANVREKLRARMGDVSVFMREFKTRFTLWYNARSGTVGTFWAERFRSVLVEPGSAAARAVAAYIDLNPVRAGMVDTPGDYRFCGLGEALSGGPPARAGYRWLRRKSKVGAASDACPNEVFAEYAAYVERLLSDSSMKAAGGTGEAGVQREGWPLLKALMERGGALGSLSWVGRLCVSGGPLGFLRGRQPSLCPADSTTEPVHAARQWVRSSRSG